MFTMIDVFWPRRVVFMAFGKAFGGGHPTPSGVAKTWLMLLVGVVMGILAPTSPWVVGGVLLFVTLLNILVYLGLYNSIDWIVSFTDNVSAFALALTVNLIKF